MYNYRKMLELGGYKMTDGIYEIKGQKVNVKEIIERNNGNLYMACNEISQRCLVSMNTAKYYVELCQRNEMFVKENSTIGFIGAMFMLIPILLTIAVKIGFLPANDGFLVFLAIALVLCSIVSFILSIVDLAGSNEIPRKHGCAIFGIVTSIILWIIVLIVTF